MLWKLFSLIVVSVFIAFLPPECVIGTWRPMVSSLLNPINCWECTSINISCCSQRFTEQSDHDRCRWWFHIESQPIGFSYEFLKPVSHWIFIQPSSPTRAEAWILLLRSWEIILGPCMCMHVCTDVCVCERENICNLESGLMVCFVSFFFFFCKVE